MTQNSHLPGSPKPLAEIHDVILFDLDGVIYIGRDPVPHAVEVVGDIHRTYGTRTAYVTNNASRTPAQVAGHLRSFGLEVADDDVVTSAQAAARVLSERLPEGSKVLVLGSVGLTWALQERGLVPVASVDDIPTAVVQGYNSEMTWHDMAEATYGINRGLLWVASNTDRTIPTVRGIGPGNGSFVKALEHATGRSPVVAGKPEPPLMIESIERTSASAPIVVGDRLDTDIEGAVRSGVPSLLVLTGVTDARAALAARPVERPTHIGRDLRALLEPQPEVVVRVEADRIEARCGDSAVVIEPDGTCSVRAADELDALRAGCGAAWTAADAGSLDAAVVADAVADRLASA